jgi:hypothetical protein
MRRRISSKDIVERRRGDGRSSAAAVEGGATGRVGKDAGGKEDMNC